MSLLSAIRHQCGVCGSRLVAAASAGASQPPRRWAGHSRWQNVRADKQAGSAQKQALTSMYTRMLRKAIADGGGSTRLQLNVHLKAVFDKAKADNMPQKTLERMLAARSLETEPYVVEVRGRGGICVLVECNNPAKIKCKQDIASFVKRVGLEVAGVDTGLAASFFDKRGRVEAAWDAEKLPDLDRATELALELDCVEVARDDSAEDAGAPEASFVFECAPAAVSAVSAGLQAAGVSVLDAGVRYLPLDPVSVDAAAHSVLLDIYDKVRDNIDGVLDVWDNVTAAG